MTTIIFMTLIIGGTALLAWPLGRYLKWAMDPDATAPGLRTKLDGIFLFIGGKATATPQGWKRYVLTMLAFNTVMFVLSFGILAFQQHLPLNPDAREALEGSLVFNTAASFTSNTNLQHYSGEVSLSYFSQLFALMWLQFVSAATGIAALTALARGLSGRKDLGNFLMDVQRATFLVLLPMAAVFATLMVLGGMTMTVGGSVIATTLEGVQQTIARGPVAAFLTIKQLGTNGGGFFGPNSTHPLENPTLFTNILSMVLLILIPMACVWMYGRIVGNLKHAAVIFGVMLTLLLLKAGSAVYFEATPTAAFAELPVEQTVGNLEGKELRLGATTGPLWGVLTTSTSNGSVGSMQNSLNPLAGLAALTGMWLNATFGGVGVGMINMFIFIVIAVFVAGLMVGRTPEYLGRKIEPREMKLAVIALITHPLFILVGTAVFAATAWGIDATNNEGPRGFTEILYEFSSAAANNGSGYEGLGDNTVPWNIATGLVMLLGRFIPIILPLAIAGSLAGKKLQAETVGTLRTDSATFGVMTLATIIFIGALTFFPVALLGPIAEHLAFMR
ncbi:MAG: potassium-transporting ATPase subunit KdpA [Oceanipulchritudo sp.]